MARKAAVKNKKTAPRKKAIKKKPIAKKVTTKKVAAKKKQPLKKATKKAAKVTGNAKEVATKEKRLERPFTPVQVAEDLGISVTYVRYLLKEHDIPKVGGRWIWNKREMQALCKRLKPSIKKYA